MNKIFIGAFYRVRRVTVSWQISFFVLPDSQLIFAFPVQNRSKLENNIQLENVSIPTGREGQPFEDVDKLSTPQPPRKKYHYQSGSHRKEYSDAFYSICRCSFRRRFAIKDVKLDTIHVIHNSDNTTIEILSPVSK